MKPKFPSREFLSNHPKIRPILKIAKKLGCSVNFNYKSSQRWWFGYYDPQDNAIVVNIHQPNGKYWTLADIAFLLAHEVRHAQHKRDKVFPSRVIIGEDKEFTRFLNSYFGIMAHSAELDCDVYAKNYIDRFFPTARSLLRDRTYPKWRIDKRFLDGQDLLIRDKVEGYYSRSLKDERV